MFGTCSFVLSGVDHRSRYYCTGIELLAIDTFPRTVNDRCVSSPEINMLHRQRLMRYSVWYTCFVTVCFWEKQEVDDDSIFFWLSLEIPRYLEANNFIFVSFPSLLAVIYQGSVQVGNQIAKDLPTPYYEKRWLKLRDTLKRKWKGLMIEHKSRLKQVPGSRG